MISPCIATPHEGEIASCGNTTVEQLQVVASYSPEGLFDFS